MKLTIPTKSLLKQLETLRPLFAGRTTLPAISMVKLSAVDGNLRASANDLNLWCEIKADSETEATGEIAVAGLRLLNAVKASQEDHCELETDKGSLRFKCGRMSMRIAGMGVSELPVIPVCSEESLFSANGEALSGCIASVLPFVSNEDSRGIICGVYFSGEEGALRLVGTNGRMLSTNVITASAKGVNAVLTPHACRLVSTMAGELKMAFAENAFSAKSDEMHIIGALIEGNFPNWKQVVPSRANMKVFATVEREALLAAIPFVASVLTDAGMPVVRFDLGNKEIALSAQSAENEARTTVPAKLEGKMSIAFDANYMTAVLNALSGEEVKLQFNDEMSASLIDDGDHSLVIMPCRVS